MWTTHCLDSLTLRSVSLSPVSVNGRGRHPNTRVGGSLASALKNE